MFIFYKLFFYLFIVKSFILFKFNQGKKMGFWVNIFCYMVDIFLDFKII